MVTSPSIEEALAALDHLTGIRQAKCCAESSETIRSALTSAAQEQKAWGEIEAWTTEYKNRAAELAHVPGADVGKEFSVRLTGRLLSEVFEADSRLAALVAAGEYCRAEMEKTG